MFQLRKVNQTNPDKVALKLILIHKSFDHMTQIEHHRSNDRIQAKFKNVKWFSLYTFAHSDWYIHKIKSVSVDYIIRFFNFFLMN